jgi:two-component system chemotaxis response regulator CheB
MPAGPDTRLDAELETELAGLLAGDPEADIRPRGYSGLTCPDCGGPLYPGAERTFDCLVGHRWSPQSLFEEHSASVERALWLAARALDERSKLAGRLASEAGERGHPITAAQFTVAAREARESADAIREVVSGMLTEVVLQPGTRGGPEGDPGAVAPGTKPA